MKLYACGKCQHLLYFENTVCLHCGSSAGFDPDTLSMITLVPATDNVFTGLEDSKKSWRFCANAVHAVCNWIIPAESDAEFCTACALNRTIPALDNAENLSLWRRIEVAKHRLVYSLLRLQLPVVAKEADEESGIAFDFLADTDPVNRVMTGHEHGVVTLNIEEADEAKRVRHKLDLGERYRTLLGHFRHEIGHYYWEVFFNGNDQRLQAFRKVFGDEQADYAKALETYYANGAPATWNDAFISPYATSHPWEDWAESWSHYLHLMDTLETAYSFGLAVDPRKATDELAMQARISRNPYSVKSFDEIISMWLPLTFAVNSLNRSMGHPDFYPFIISVPVIAKLKFIHETVNGFAALQQQPAATTAVKANA